jgi:hypothetical protein
MDNSIVKKVFILLAIACLVVGAAYVLSVMGGREVPRSDIKADSEEQSMVTEPVVHKLDVTAATTPEDKLPQGFPQDIPVNLETIVAGSTSAFTGRTYVQYSVSFLSDRTRAQEYQSYLSFMTNAGYEFGSAGRNPQQFSLYGTKDNDDLSITISEQSGKTLVHIGYLDRQ